MQFDYLWLVYLIPVVLIWFFIQGRSAQRTRKSLAIKRGAEEAGLVEPPSLHPLINLDQCVGCGTCVTACPEKTVLGMIDGKAHLIEPTLCIGHGACAAACPTQSISLVFGTETRGVDIPFVSPQFETNIPGIYIAGELGGMGLIRNAVEQGRQAIGSIVKRLKSLPTKTPNDDCFDTIIIGAGPAGISASLGALEKKLKYCTIEQDTMGGTVAHYPRGKLVMTAPANLPLIGKTRFGEVQKEELLAFWSNAIEEYDLNIRYQEQLLAVEMDGDLFKLTTSKDRYVTKSILLAIGRRGTPRTLDVPGEEMAKVLYRLADPEEYQGQHVLVVGGGDSALEAAVTLAEQPGNTVTLSYRSNSFSRARQKNRDKLKAMEGIGNLNVMLNSSVQNIEESSVCIEHDGQQKQLPNDAVIICAGGILPTGFLKEIGIAVERKFGTA
jgi:thioredoxin reductase (NADPH)